MQPNPFCGVTVCGFEYIYSVLSRALWLIDSYLLRSITAKTQDLYKNRSLKSPEVANLSAQQDKILCYAYSQLVMQCLFARYNKRIRKYL